MHTSTLTLSAKEVTPELSEAVFTCTATVGEKSETAAFTLDGNLLFNFVLLRFNCYRVLRKIYLLLTCLLNTYYRYYKINISLKSLIYFKLKKSRSQKRKQSSIKWKVKYCKMKLLVMCKLRFYHKYLFLLSIEAWQSLKFNFSICLIFI